MVKNYIVTLLLVVSLTGCSSIVGMKSTTSVSVTEASTESLLETPGDASISNEDLIEEESTRVGLGDISIGNESIDSGEQFGKLVVPTKPKETTTERETEYNNLTNAAIATLESTTERETTTAQTTAVDWGETPTMYSGNYGSPKFKTNINVPDKSNVKRDSYGNYVIPYEMFSHKDQLPYNERGKIPYMFWYDQYGNILNPLPDELKKYEEHFELGIYVNQENNLKQLLPTVEVN